MERTQEGYTMWQRILAGSVLLILPWEFRLNSNASAEDPPRNAPPSLNELSMEVAALQALHVFRLTPAQMEKLRNLSKQTAEQAGARPAPKVSAKFRQALLDLRTALAKAD